MTRKRRPPRETHTPTTERLARALESLNDPRLATMIQKARDGRYDDYKSPLAFPIRQLVLELRAFGLEAMAQRVIAGEFDAAGWEAEAWANSEEGQAVFREFLGGIKNDP